MGGVIVTGAFGALGRATVAELKARGLSVAAVDMSTTPEDFDADILLGGIELAEGTAVAKAYARAAEELGGIDGLVNIAGGFVWETVESGSIDSWDRMYAMNLRSCVVSSSAALPHLLATGGAIVNIGAAAAANAAMGMAPYAASKAGVKAFTESLADELKSKGVRVNAILPTIMDTPTNRADMPDADRSAWVLPGSAARTIAWLLSPESGSITGTATVLSLPG